MMSFVEKYDRYEQINGLRGNIDCLSVVLETGEIC